MEGHEDWVLDVKFVETDDNKLLLASCSKDSYIRLWKIEKELERKEKESEVEEMTNPAKYFKVEGKLFGVRMEALLVGHENWVHSVDWHPPIPSSSPPFKTQPMMLLSASMDRSMILWQPDEEEEGVWVDRVRVGEIGGNTLGFYGCSFSKKDFGKKMVASGYKGSFHMWQLESPSLSSQMKWKPVICQTGHSGGVVDICFSKEGDYFLSASEDQTVRLYSEWKRGDGKWYEIGRPQVHGHEMQCLSLLPSLEHSFISAAQEKMLRVFEAPSSFLSSLHFLSGQSLSQSASSRPLGASLPPLGLSNKPISQPEEESAAEDNIDNFAPAKPAILSEPPLEEHLFQSTLWPETNKLYAHGNHLYSVSVSHDGTLIASSCKGTKPPLTDIIIWDSKTFKPVQQINALSFYFLSVFLIFSALYLYRRVYSSK